jgi:membrane dipeptidase
MITLVPDHTDLDAPNASLFHVVDHIRHVGKLIGYDHVGIGSDFDGMARAVQGVEDVGQYPNLVAAMLMKGMAESDVEKVLGLNLIRVLAEVEKVASEYFQQFPALEEAIPQLWNDDIRAFAQSVYPHAEGPRKRRDKGV